jgi:hypothetical protein
VGLKGFFHLWNGLVYLVETRRESNLGLEPQPIKEKEKEKEKAADCDWARGEKESPRIEETTAPADLWRRLDCLTGLPSLPPPPWPLCSCVCVSLSEISLAPVVFCCPARSDKVGQSRRLKVVVGLRRVSRSGRHARSGTVWLYHPSIPPTPPIIPRIPQIKKHVKSKPLIKVLSKLVHYDPPPNHLWQNKHGFSFFFFLALMP